MDLDGTDQAVTVRRVSASDLSVEACPAFRLRKPASKVRVPPRHAEAFLLGAVRDGIMLRLCDSLEPDAIRAWVARRFPRLSVTESNWVLAAIAAFPDPAHDGLRLLRHGFVPQVSRGQAMYEMVTWGLFAETEDGTTRRVYLLRYSANAEPYEPARIAAAAYCVGNGVPAVPPAPRDWYGRPHQSLPSTVEPERVEVVEFFASAGVARSHPTLTPDEARARYEADGRPVSREAQDPDVQRPGLDCDECALASSCPSLPQFPGVLGLSRPNAHRRTWSATNGRYYRACPHWDHLYRQRIGTRREPISAERIGRAVDARLAEIHRRGVACDRADAPLTGQDWQRLGHRLNDAEAARAAALLKWHAGVLCPFSSSLVTEPPHRKTNLLGFDSDVNVVLKAQADLLYLEAGEWVWRETKCPNKLPNLGVNPLEGFHKLQLSTVLLLLAGGIMGDGRPVRRVELEILHPDDSDIQYIDATPIELARARAVVQEAIVPWLDQPSKDTTPGQVCNRCQFAPLCPDSAVSVESS